MESFPYLIVLFLFTVIAALAWGARSWEKAQRAADKTEAGQRDVRMAVERSKTGELISEMVAERDAKPR